MSPEPGRRPRSAWIEGRVPGHEVAALTGALLLTVAVLDLLMSGRVGLFYDLAFVSLCAAAAVAVRHGDFFVIGVWPPLAMLAVMALFAIADPGTVAEASDGAVQATVTGLSSHSLGLLAGYGVCLVTLAWRRQVGDREDRRAS
jgi:hypothetical protein